jgi:hypothetical protein
MRVLVFAAALALIACSPKAPQQQQPQTQTAQSPQQPGAVATTHVADQSSKPGSGDTPVDTTPILDRDFLVGRWGDNGDCTKDVVLNGNGSFTSYTGGEGQWALNGATLRMEGKNGAYDLQLELIDQNTLRITNPDGSVGTSQRCE